MLSCPNASLLKFSFNNQNSAFSNFSMGHELFASTVTQTERPLQPRDHLWLVMLLVGIFPRPHAVAAGLDRDDVAPGSDLPHGFAKDRRLLVWHLIVARAVDREK